MSKFAPLAGDAHLTIVLGAGASAPSGLPNWDQFAQQVALLSGLVDSHEAADVLLSKQDQTIVLEAARTQSGSNWTTHLDRALYGDLAAEPSPSPLHFAAAGHYLTSPRTTTLSTLNFDTLLEAALLSEGEPLAIIGLDGSAHPGVPTVHHLHGAIFDGTAYGPVVGFRDYAELVADETAWQRKFLSEALARGPLLLAGTSYRDPDIRHWLHLIFRDENPAHPALVTIAREGLGLDRDMFDAVDKALASEWESIGLTALRMQDLADVALVIRELQHVGHENYLPPTDRARRVWSSHSGSFTKLQDEYGQALASDAVTASKALGTRAHRATLWIANGRGMLARWATEGSQYRGISYLKFVPTGHDSPWIAGEAIGSEEVKLKDIERDRRVTPNWRSVLAIPIFAGDGQSPDFAAAVLTFGLSQSAATLLTRQAEWSTVIQDLSTAWGARIGDVAFPHRAS